MKIKSSQLPKATLAKIVDYFRPHPITDELMAGVLREASAREASGLIERLKAMEADLKARHAKFNLRTSKKKIAAYEKDFDKYERARRRFCKLVEEIREIDAAYPRLGDEVKE